MRYKFYSDKILAAEYRPEKGEGLDSSKVKALEILAHEFEKDKKKYAGREVYIRREPEAFREFDSDSVFAVMRHHFKHPDFILKE